MNPQHRHDDGVARRAWEAKYSAFTAMLPTKAFLAPMDEDEEIEVELAKGNKVIIKYKALSELQPNGKRCGPTDSLT